MVSGNRIYTPGTEYVSLIAYFVKCANPDAIERRLAESQTALEAAIAEAEEKRAREEQRVADQRAKVQHIFA